MTPVQYIFHVFTYEEVLHLTLTIIKKKAQKGKASSQWTIRLTLSILFLSHDLPYWFHGEEGRRNMVKVYDLLERNCIKLNTTYNKYMCYIFIRGKAVSLL